MLKDLIQKKFKSTLTKGIFELKHAEMIARLR